jgi:hypothetical protein
MQWSDIPFHPPRRTLRQFAGLWIVFFGGWAAWQWWGQENTSLALVLAVVAGLVSCAGLIRPELIRPIFVGWIILVFPIGWAVSTVLLAILFYGLFLVVGLCFKAIGRDPLTRRYDPDLPTYWTAKPQPAGGLRSYFNQF